MTAKAWAVLLASLLLGSIIASTAGIFVNYVISWIGIWHAHVRRDIWLQLLHQHIPTQINVQQNRPHRFLSYAPERTAQGYLQWHVDGQDTFAAMQAAIEKAKFQILIGGWLVCPDLYLERPESFSGESQPKSRKSLKELLLAKAEEGVLIYILLYREVRLVMDLGSYYARKSLAQHKNIRVLRDPDFQLQFLGFWSHHEKIMVVDAHVAFLGGLDLAFGRFDTSEHVVSDPGTGKPQVCHRWPGKEYYNPIIKEFVNVNRPMEDLIDRTAVPRMPWHDVQCSVAGVAAMDVAMHFIERWNFVCAKKDNSLRTDWCKCCRTRRFKYLPKSIVPLDVPEKIHPHHAHLAREFHHHAIAPAARTDDFSCTKTENETKEPGHLLPSSSPSSYYGGGKAPDFDLENITCHVSRSSNNPYVPCSLQVLRSVSQWSAGVPTEASIHTAYCETIRRAKHYVYVENQFFISGLDDNTTILNRIVQALVDRIAVAVKQDDVFRVYIVMPLLPAAEGSFEGKTQALTHLHAIMHWQYETIRSSLMGALEKFTDTPYDYVFFFGLRSFGVMPNGRLVTEQIYIHSKVMIVDDTTVIIGSANINDRSLNGDRDSEIAVIMEDTTVCR